MCLTLLNKFEAEVFSVIYPLKGLQGSDTK